MCQVLNLHPSGYYAWLEAPQSQRDKDDQYLLGFIKQFWLESESVYGYRKVYKDMLSIGEQCGRNRVLRLMRSEGLRSQRGYKKFKGNYSGGQPSTLAPNLLNREFAVDEPNKVWVTDITYVRTHEGWLFVAIVLDLFSRQIIGWSMNQRITTDLVLDALTMAIW